LADNITIPTQGLGDATPLVATDDVSGAHYQRVKPDFGGDGVAQAVSVDVGVSDAGTQRVVLARSSAVSPQLTYVTEAAISPGSSSTLTDSAQITSGKTGYLLGFTASSSVPIKVELRTVLNGIASANKMVRFGTDIEWTSPDAGAITVAEDPTAGLDGFRLVITNLNTSVEAADVYATFIYDEI
jgi:hypothetical protein